MINYFNFKKIGNKILITNDIGRYSFVSEKEFTDLLSDKMSNQTDKYSELTEKGFISSEHFLKMSSKLANEYANYKNYVFHSTELHIFVVTNNCNMNCVYCQAQSDKSLCKGKMSYEIAKKSVDFALMSPASSLSFEFQGGEPLLNFDVIKYIVEYSESVKNNKIINYSLVTNTTPLNNEMVDFFKKHDISVSVSLDGNKELHDKNRPAKNGSSNYDILIDNINILRNNSITPSAIQTTTRSSLNKWKDIVDNYVENGFYGLFVRPLTPLGYANDHWNEIGYTAEEYIDFYKNILTYIIELNRKGICVKEYHTILFLEKIINNNSGNYMELRSPCGAAIGQMAYYFDGNVFSCDEGRMLYEMGNDAFLLGNVYSNNYSDVIKSSKCKALCKSTILEVIPGCADCVYMPYCGVCPVVNYAYEGNLITRNYKNYRCKIYRGMLDFIFESLSDCEVYKIFSSWVG